MNRRMLALAALALMLALPLLAAATAPDLSRMNRDELVSLKNAIDAELKENHEAGSAERDKVLEVTKLATEAYFKKLNIDISWAWLNYEYTRDWNFYTLKTHIDFKDPSGTKRKPDVYAEAFDSQGTFQLVYLLVGPDVLLDQRASLPADYRGAPGSAPLSLTVGGTPLKTVTVTPRPAQKVTAGELIEAYGNNEVKADAAYKGQLLEVTGKVTGVRTSWGRTIVDLGTGAAFEWGVNCYMEGSQTNAAAQLDTGDTVTIIGTCDGLSFLMVSLDDCVFK